MKTKDNTKKNESDRYEMCFCEVEGKFHFAPWQKRTGTCIFKDPFNDFRNDMTANRNFKNDVYNILNSNRQTKPKI